MFPFSTKRQWTPDESIDSEDIAIREKKRLRPLTLRTPPDTCQTTLCEANQLFPRFHLSSLTPIEPSDDNSNDQYRSDNAALPTTSLHRPLPGSSSDSSMDVDTLPSSISGDGLSPSPMSTQHSHGSVQPSPIPHSLINQSLNIDGGHPAATNQTSFANPDPNVAMDQDFIPGAEVSGLHPDAARNHETVWWTLPGIPSPISEDEGVCVTGTGTPASEVEIPYATSHSASSHPYGVHHDQALWNTDMQAPSTSNISHEEPERSIPAANMASNKKKLNVFMGYRADCDKCRQKVPGHYSHIVHN